MTRKLWLSVAAAAIGTSLLVAAGFAGAATSGVAIKHSAAQNKGGTLRVNVPNGDFEYTDPGLAYDTLGWSMLYTTQMLLVNYPDKAGDAGSKLYPEAASAFPTVSKDGKTYTFTIRPGLKMSDGSPITAANYKRAIERNLSPKMGEGSPVGVNVHLDDLIAGAKDFLNGKTQAIGGIKATGQTLTVTLTKADPTFLAIMGMQWFGAVKPDMAYTDKGIDAYPGSGPYYIKSRDVGKTLLLERNPNYKGTRPANPDRIIFTVNVEENQSLLQVRNGDADATLTVPTAQNQSLGDEFGVNKGRYFVGPQNCVLYLALNTTAGRLLANASGRKAVNWGIDRPAMVRVRGKYAGKRHTQILVPGVPGYKPFGLYAIKGANVDKAKQVGGSAITGQVKIYHSTSSANTNVAQVIQYNMKQIGFDTKLLPTSPSVYYKTLGTKGVDEDIALAGWCADYKDPFDFINVLLDGRTIQDSNNVNFSYMNVPALNTAMDQAAAQSGDARYNAYAKLDLTIMRDYAPWAPYMVPNSRFFVSSRTKNVVYINYFGEPDYAAMSVG